VQVARHPERPGAREVFQAIGRDFIELAGGGAADGRMVGGLARIRDHGVVLIGHDRPRGTAECPKAAEGLARSERLLRLADRFRLPAVIVADASLDDAEAGGALARCVETALEARVPVLSVVLGAVTGPAAALCLAVDATMMLEHAVFAPLPPEAAAALWPDADPARAAAAAAEALGLTAAALKERGVIDAVIPEPCGGAHRQPHVAAREIGGALIARLDTLRHVEGAWLRARRRERLAAFGRAPAPGG
jgi:acetyl-CoA carboxylase carboxyl transferase subunit alpha